jgi:membrane peptidoglycan carboxypeptidase
VSPHTAHRSPPRLRRKAAVALACAALVLLAGAAGAAGTLYASLPGVADAGRRAVARLGGAPPVTATALPRRVATAVVAVEDERYWRHGAVDPIAIGRALVAAVEHPGRDPGGSTIAQQLARQLYLPAEGAGGALVTPRAIGIAFKLEARYTKAQILAMYLNSVYLGHGRYGVAAASRAYFDTTPARLTWGEASLIAGLPQAPSADDPLRHLARARAREREVLARLVVDGDLTAAGAAAAYRDTPRPHRMSTSPLSRSSWTSSSWWSSSSSAA